MEAIIPQHGDGLVEERVEKVSVKSIHDPVTHTDMAVYFGRGLHFRCTLHLPALINLREELQGKEVLVATGIGTSKRDAIAVACLDAVSKLYLNNILDDHLIIQGRCRPARNRPILGHWLKKKDLTPVTDYLRELPTCFTVGSKIFYDTKDDEESEEKTDVTPDLIDAYLYVFELDSHDSPETRKLGPIGLLLPQKIPPSALANAVLPALPPCLPDLDKAHGTSRLRFCQKLQVSQESVYKLKKFQLALFDLLRMRGKPLGCSFDEAAFSNFFNRNKYSSPTAKPSKPPPPNVSEGLPDLSLGASATSDEQQKGTDQDNAAEGGEETEEKKEFVVDWSIQKNWLCVPVTEAGIEWASVERATENEKGGTPLRHVIRRMETDGVDTIPADVVVQKYTNPFMFFVSVAFTTEEEIERLAKEDETREEDDERANPQVGF